MISSVALLKGTLLTPIIWPRSISSISGPARSTTATPASRAGRRCSDRIGIAGVGRFLRSVATTPSRSGMIAPSTLNRHGSYSGGRCLGTHRISRRRAISAAKSRLFSEQRRGARGQVGDFVVHGSSPRVLDKGHRFAKVDAAKRAPSAVIRVRFWLSCATASYGCPLLGCCIHQLTLRDCRAHDGAGIAFLSPFRQQCASRPHGVTEGRVKSA